MAVSQLDSCALLPFSAGQLTPMQAIEARHAVRSYIDEPLAPEAVEVLREAIARVNEEANLNIQLVLDEPRAFTGFKARLVNFTNVRNYLALVGPECKELDGFWLTTASSYAAGPVARAEQLLGRGHLQGGEPRLQCGSGPEAGRRDSARIWDHAGGAAPVEGAPGGGPGLRRGTGVVQARGGRGPARSHSLKPAEVLLLA